MYHQKAFWASRWSWKAPKFSLSKEGELSAQVEDEISRDGWGIKTTFIQINCLNAKQNLSAPHLNTTDRHILFCEQRDPKLLQNQVL